MKSYYLERNLITREGVKRRPRKGGGRGRLDDRASRIRGGEPFLIDDRFYFYFYFYFLPAMSERPERRVSISRAIVSTTPGFAPTCVAWTIPLRSMITTEGSASI